jgi:hypothetical protein
MFACTKCNVVCGYDHNDQLNLRPIEVSVEKTASDMFINGVTVLDITNTHDETILMSQEDWFSSLVLQEHNNMCQSANDKIKDTSRKWKPLPAHFVIKCPFLCLGILSPNSIIEYSQFDFGWDQHKTFIFKYIIQMCAASEIAEKIEVLITYFGFDYKKRNINFVLRLRQFGSFSTQAEKIQVLLDMGFAFDMDNFPLSVVEIMSLDDEIIEQLVNNGLNIKKIVENGPHLLNRLSDESMDKLIKFDLDVHFIAKTLLNRTGLVPLLKKFVENHNLDITSCLD